MAIQLLISDLDGTLLGPESVIIPGTAAALEQARTGALTDAQGLVPVYHRLSQAERERLERLRAEEAAEKTR